MTRVEIQTRIQPIVDRGDCYIFKGVGSFYYRFATFMTPSIFRYCTTYLVVAFDSKCLLHIAGIVRYMLVANSMCMKQLDAMI